MKPLHAILIALSVLLLVAAFFLGRSSKECIPPYLDRSAEIDSLLREAEVRERHASDMGREIDTLRARATAPREETTVEDAYRSLAVDVDSLAAIIRAAPIPVR